MDEQLLLALAERTALWMSCSFVLQDMELLYGKSCSFGSCMTWKSFMDELLFKGSCRQRTALWKSSSLLSADMELLFGRAALLASELLYGRAALLAFADMELLYGRAACRHGTALWMSCSFGSCRHGTASSMSCSFGSCRHGTALWKKADMELLYGRAAQSSCKTWNLAANVEELLFKALADMELLLEEWKSCSLKQFLQTWNCFIKLLFWLLQTEQLYP